MSPLADPRRSHNRIPSLPSLLALEVAVARWWIKGLQWRGIRDALPLGGTIDTANSTAAIEHQTRLSAAFDATSGEHDQFLSAYSRMERCRSPAFARLAAGLGESDRFSSYELGLR